MDQFFELTAPSFLLGLVVVGVFLVLLYKRIHAIERRLASTEQRLEQATRALAQQHVEGAARAPSSASEAGSVASVVSPQAESTQAKATHAESAQAKAAQAVTPPPLSVREAHAAPASAAAPTPKVSSPEPGWSSRERVAVPPPIIPVASFGEARADAGRPPVPPPPPREAPPREAPSAKEEGAFDLERWIGIRGAAVLGGIILAISGFLVVQYSIEHQLISPQTRVILAAITGVVCMIGASFLRKRGYEILSNSITGAGAVLLYASSWAAHVLYGMVEFPVAFGAMIAVTVVCGWLAERHGSQLIAVLGLAGGFATPLVLSSGQNRPIGLFGYVLFLDLGYLFVARKKRWPAVGLVALAGTFVVQALWIFFKMERADLAVGLVVLGVFAVLFAGFMALLLPSERRRWVVSQAGAVLLPFVFALYFAQDHDLGVDLWPTMALAALLTIASGWLARFQDAPWLPFGSALGAVALAFTWIVSREFDMTTEQAWELALCGIAIVAIQRGIAWLASRGATTSVDVRTGATSAAIAAVLGFQIIGLYAASRPLVIEPRPWMGLTLVLALVALQMANASFYFVAPIVSCGLAGVTAFAWIARHGETSVMPAPLFWYAATITAGGVYLLVAWSKGRESRGRALWAVAAYVLPLMAAPIVCSALSEPERALFYAAVIVMGAQLAFAATGAHSSALFILAVLATWSVACFDGFRPLVIAKGPQFPAIFALFVFAAALFSVWPVGRPAFWRDRPMLWRAAATAPFLWFLPIRQLFEARWPGAPVFVLPIAFESIAGVAALRLHALRDGEDRAQRIGRIWFTGVAILFAAMVLPLQIGRNEIALTLALFGAGLAVMRLRIDYRPIGWVAAGALVVTTAFMVFVRPWDGFAHSEMRVWNALAYLYLVPAMAAIVASACLRRADGLRSATGTIAAVCAIVGIFAWINLEITNAFATTPRFSWSFERDPARGLTTSLAWALYAIALLVLGVSKQRSGVRWASLALLLLTIGKVFLFDLGHLEGLYRAGSMLGLALSLLLVSLLYQRFVFRRNLPVT